MCCFQHVHAVTVTAPGQGHTRVALLFVLSQIHPHIETHSKKGMYMRPMG